MVVYLCDSKLVAKGVKKVATKWDNEGRQVFVARENERYRLFVVQPTRLHILNYYPKTREWTYDKLILKKVSENKYNTFWRWDTEPHGYIEFGVSRGKKYFIRTYLGEISLYFKSDIWKSFPVQGALIKTEKYYKRLKEIYQIFSDTFDRRKTENTIETKFTFFDGAKNVDVSVFAKGEKDFVFFSEILQDAIDYINSKLFGIDWPRVDKINIEIDYDTFTYVISYFSRSPCPFWAPQFVLQVKRIFSDFRDKRYVYHWKDWNSIW